jgi:hypothetical protein
METRSRQPMPRSDFELRFNSLLKTGSGFVFPCDVDGVVPIDEFTETLRNNYFYARAVVGAELAWPVIARSSTRLERPWPRRLAPQKFHPARPRGNCGLRPIAVAP